MAMYLGSNKVELGQAVASGGGGSSDFSTAEVTLIGTYGSNFGLYEYGQYDETLMIDTYQGVFLYDGKLLVGNPRALFVDYGEFGPTTYTLYYIGDSYSCYPDNTYISSTGAVTYDSETAVLTITGDCTITGWVSD